MAVFTPAAPPASPVPEVGINALDILSVPLVLTQRTEIIYDFFLSGGELPLTLSYGVRTFLSSPKGGRAVTVDPQGLVYT